MPRIFIETSGPGSWQQLLADPDKHWRTEYSARSLAYSWETANGLPEEIVALLKSKASFKEADPELLVAFPEWKVPLPGGQRESQNDVFALVRAGDETLAIAVEGKVSEPFGPTVEEWYSNPSKGKVERLSYLCDMLGLSIDDISHLRYQLLHRTASAVIERRRFGMDIAAMIVHSFSQTNEWFDDYSAFLKCLGHEAAIGSLVLSELLEGDRLLLGWAKGNPKFLEM